MDKLVILFVFSNGVDDFDYILCAIMLSSTTIPAYYRDKTRRVCVCVAPRFESAVNTHRSCRSDVNLFSCARKRETV